MEQPTSLPHLPAGVYRHYKGHHYLVLGFGHDSNVDGRNVVVYVGLELEGASRAPRMNVRTVEDFFASVELSGRKVRRFTYIGPIWPGQELPG